jgi:hypothetical protein
MKLLIIQLSPAFHHVISLQSKYSLQHCSQTPYVHIPLIMLETMFHTLIDQKPKCGIF